MENVTKTMYESGYLIHNEKQISVEIDEQIILFEVDNVDNFIKENQL